MGIGDWLKHGGYKDNSPFNIVGQTADWFSTFNDAPAPGYDANGNLIIQPQSTSYNNDRRLTDAYQSQFALPNPGSKDPFGPDTSWIDALMAGVMGGSPGSSGKAEGAAAAAAFNPVFANLAAEKLAAQKRGKKNQKDIKGAYAALADDYVRQAAAEVKGHAKATKEQNQAFSKDVFETKDQYTKLRAESDAEAARLGQTGTSAQQIADQKIGMASAQAVDAQKYQQNMNKAASDQMSKSQSNYMTRGSMIAPQAGAEQVNISKNKLEDVLLGLNKEEAQARLQQTAARLAAQSSAKRNPTGPDISTILALNNEKQDIQDRFAKAMTNGVIDPNKLRGGLTDALTYGNATGKVTPDAYNKFMEAFNSDADINNGTYQDPTTKKQVTMNKNMKTKKIYDIAVAAGIPTATARQMAEIYSRGS